MEEFWETNFKEKQIMWGFEPTDSALSALNFFIKHGLNKILIPGFGYGRNAKVFKNSGFDVTGIEISETAIELAKKHLGDNLKVHHRSVCDMPFNQELYDGIYCYALIHLLDEDERRKLINDCYIQLKPGGYMIFMAVSTRDSMFGQGVKIGHNRFKSRHCIDLYFYNSNAVEMEFGKAGLIEAIEISEPAIPLDNQPVLKFWQITCRKQ